MQDLENHAYQFQSTLPSQGATDLPEGIASVLDISIHAPLTGSDRTFLILNIRGTIFQSTLPSQGATMRAIRLCITARRFQSTLPSQGAT